METLQDRKENLDALISKAAEWEGTCTHSCLSSFLEELCLKSTLDEAIEPTENIHLMTLHNGKGLEFLITFIAGMEERLLPHMNCINSTQSLEEERRLCYVGMTRAKKVLYLTSCAFRFVWGSSQWMRPSRFLKEIPLECIACEKKNSFAYDQEERPPSQALFDIGEKVFHQDFGEGIIESCSESSLGTIYRVRFHQDESIRSLVAKYGRLKAVS